MTPTHRLLAAPAAAAAALLLLSACTPGSEPEPQDSSAAAEPATTASATAEVVDEYPAAVSRDLDLDFGATTYDRFPACHHDGPVTVQGGRSVFTPSDPTDEMGDAEVELTITGAPTFLEIGPGGRVYASVPFTCEATGGGAAVLDSGEFIAGGTQEAMSIVGIVTAGDALDDDGPGDASGGEANASSAANIQLREPAGIGTTVVHSSLRNGDGYRYYSRAAQDGDTDTPSQTVWTTVQWDDEAGAIRQLERSEDLLETVPRPDETLVLAANGDDGIILGEEDLDEQETFDAIEEFLGDPTDESSEFAESGDHQGYRSETKVWDGLTVTLYSPADGEPDWVGTCLAWSGDLGDMPQSVTVGSPVQLGSSMDQYPHLSVEDAPHVRGGEAPGMVDDGSGRYTFDVVGGTAETGMIDTLTSGTGCARD